MPLANRKEMEMNLARHNTGYLVYAYMSRKTSKGKPDIYKKMPMDG